MQKLTKIVATLGPATETEEIMKELIEAGMNVARFNTKHGTPEWHLERIRRVKKVAAEMGKSIGVLLDLQGPEIRINIKDGKEFDLAVGEEVTFTVNGAREKEMSIPKKVIDTVQVGDKVSSDDGICEFEIIAKNEETLTAKTTGACTIKHRKTMNTPGIMIDMPSLIENDLIQLDNMTDDDIDFIGLSFVRDSKDINILRAELKKRDLHPDIISKIENQASLDNIDEIIENSDGIMVARGDLAVEVPFEQLSHWQKVIINKCRIVGKPVITATQMLESMTFNPLPTRAEVSDVANAIYDGTDAVMLSGETTIGKYPVKCVKTQAKIATYNEKYAKHVALTGWNKDEHVSSITYAAFAILVQRNEDIDAIVCLTRTGRTAKQISKFRPTIEVKAVTCCKSVYNKMSLSHAINPFLVDNLAYLSEKELIDILKENNIVKVGQKVLMIVGFGDDMKTRKNNALLIVDIK